MPGEILLENSTKIELLLPGKLLDNPTPKLNFASLSSSIGYVHCRPCSSLNLCSAYRRQSKIRCCFSWFNFQLHCTTKQSSLKLYKKNKRKEKERKQKKRTSSTVLRFFFTFRCLALNARSLNYVICISHGINLSKRRLIRKFQPTNVDSKPKTKRKDQI